MPISYAGLYFWWERSTRFSNSRFASPPWDHLRLHRAFRAISLQTYRLFSQRGVDTSSGRCYHLTMKEIPAAKFKEQCLSILDRVGEEGIVITKRGKPVAKLIPIRTESAQLIGKLKGRLKVKGDVFSTGLKWH